MAQPGVIACISDRNSSSRESEFREAMLRLAEMATTLGSAYRIPTWLKRTVRRKPFRPRSISTTALRSSEWAVLDHGLRSIPALRSCSADADEAVRFVLLDRKLEVVLNVDTLSSGVETAPEDIHPSCIAEE